MAAKPPKLDEMKRTIPCVVWEWPGIDHHVGLRYRVVRAGAGKGDWIIESSSDNTPDAMGKRIWKMVHLEPDSGTDTLDAFQAFLWHLRTNRIDAIAGETKAAKS